MSNSSTITWPWNKPIISQRLKHLSTISNHELTATKFQLSKTSQCFDHLLTIHQEFISRLAFISAITITNHNRSTNHHPLLTFLAIILDPWLPTKPSLIRHDQSFNLQPSTTSINQQLSTQLIPTYSNPQPINPRPLDHPGSCQASLPATAAPPPAAPCFAAADPAAKAPVGDGLTVNQVDHWWMVHWWTQTMLNYWLAMVAHGKNILADTCICLWSMISGSEQWEHTVAYCRWSDQRYGYGSILSHQ